MTEVAERDTALEGSIDGEGGVTLDVGDERFECRKVSVSWEMMKFAIAQTEARTRYAHPVDDEDDDDARDEHNETCKSCAAIAVKRNDAGMRLMVIMHNVILKLLKPRERERFEEFMVDAALKPNELEEAIGDVMSALGGDKGKRKRRSHSSASEHKTNVPSRTISFDRATVDHHEVT
jgi:hypothetical protein